MANRPKSAVQYVVDASGCWLWQRATTKQGYGKVRVDGQLLLAHRVFYERERGPIPDGLVLDHLCRVPGCVNPDHLEPVTNAENIRRGRTAVYSADQAAQVHELADRGESRSRIAQLLDVDYWTVGSILRSQRWAL